MMACDCIKKTNEALAEHNTELDTVLQYNMETVEGKRRANMGITLLVPTRKIDSKKRKGPIKLHINYCPLCGTKVEGRR